VNQLLASLAGSAGTLGSGVPTDLQLMGACNPCVRALVRRALRTNQWLLSIQSRQSNLVLTGQLTVANTFIRVACQKDALNKNQFCMQRIAILNEKVDLKATLGVCTNPTLDACKTGVANVYTHLGCCVGALLRYLDYLNMLNATANPAKSVQVVGLLGILGYPNTQGMAQSTCAQKALNLSITFWNAKYAAYQAQVKLVTSKTLPSLLQNLWFSLLQYLELDAAQVTLDWTKGLMDDGNGNVKLNFIARFDSDMETTQSMALYADSDNVANCPLGDVSANPVNTRVDSTMEVSLSASSISAEQMNDCNLPAGCTLKDGTCTCPALPSDSSASNTLRSSLAVVSLIAFVGSLLIL